MRNIHRENIVKASLEKSTNTEGQTMSPLAAPHFHYHSAIDRFSPLGRPNPLPYILTVSQAISTTSDSSSVYIHLHSTDCTPHQIQNGKAGLRGER